MPLRLGKYWFKYANIISDTAELFRQLIGARNRRHCDSKTGFNAYKTVIFC